MALKRAVSVPTPTANLTNGSGRRAKSESTTERVRDAPSEEEALSLLMDASRAEKKKRCAAKTKNQTGVKLDSAASSGQGAKRRIRDALTEEAALEILLTASIAEAKRRKQAREVNAGKSDDCMAGAVPVKVCPADGQGALDIQMGSRGESDSEQNSQHAATFELVAPNSPVHVSAKRGDAASASPRPQQQCRSSSSNGPTTADGNNSAQHPSAERQRVFENGASLRRIPPCAVSANSCDRSAGSDDSSALRLSCIAEPNAFGVKPLAAQQVGEPKISYEPPSAERLSSAVEANPCTHQHEVKTHIMPPAAEQGGTYICLLYTSDAADE